MVMGAPYSVNIWRWAAAALTARSPRAYPGGSRAPRALGRRPGAAAPAAGAAAAVDTEP